MSWGLEIKGLSAGYRRRAVLGNVSLAPINPGSVVALVGANASGKSTLLRTIAGQLPALSGKAELDGIDLLGLDAGTRKRMIGYMPQSLPSGGSLYAWEAVMAASRATRPELSQAETEAQLEKVFAQLGLRALAVRKLSELSGGQRQMVGLAQLVVRQPRLMLLDEPTSALDPRWQLEVFDVVRALTHETGAIAMLAIHDLNLALRFCDHVVVLAEGRVLADGSPHEAMNAQVLSDAYGIEGRVEQCSNGSTIVLVDRALSRINRGES
ncbi:MAG TPA: ABC transporter ATP-binding protein [Rhodocyclaceae bacterium]|nr:ABC transporter ATP-binding protein [Rhodocyclaceae bacterium]